MHLQVAVKVINLNASASPQLVTQLQQKLQARFQAIAECTHVCRYLGVTTAGGKVCVVMQLYEETLTTYIHKENGKIRASYELHAIFKTKFYSFSVLQACVNVMVDMLEPHWGPQQ